MADPAGIVGIEIVSVQAYIGHIKEHVLQWSHNAVPWFRGEFASDTPLLPRLYRPQVDGGVHNENNLVQMFRMKAPTFAPGSTPPREHTDEWLFLAQHVGLPTRLLDWTESSLVGLYFALQNPEPVVWMMEPFALNRECERPGSWQEWDQPRIYPLTWVHRKGGRNPAAANIDAAWEEGVGAMELPVAVHPTYLHQRMSAQRSVFTVHGSKREPMPHIVPSQILRRFHVDPARSPELLADLHRLGIHHSTAFPDLDGLTRELAAEF